MDERTKKYLKECEIQFHKKKYRNQYDLFLAAFKPLKEADGYVINQRPN